MKPSAGFFPPVKPTAAAAGRRCLVCGEAIRRRDVSLPLGTDVVHEQCGLYQPRARGVAYAEARR